MSGILREWIAATVERELADASIWAETRSPVGVTAASTRYTRTTNGLIVQLSKGRPLQVIEIHGQGSGSVDTTLSDGQTRIQATFTPDGTRNFERYHGGSFGDRVKGGILRVTRFNLGINFSPASLSFMVIDFKFMGSENSPTVGEPVDISNLRTINTHMVRLREAIESRSRGPINRTSNASPLSSSQLEFATQLPHNIDVSQTVPRPLAAMNKTSKASTSADYMDLFKANVKKSSPASADVKQGELKSAPRTTLDSDISKSKYTSNDCASNMLSSSAAQPEPDQASNDTSGQSQGTPNNREQGVQIAKGTPISELRVAIVNSKEEKSEKTHPNKIIKNRGSPPTKSEVVVVDQNALQLEPDAPSIIKLTSGGPSFTEMKRIPKKFVRVPKDQMELLMRDDSWRTNNNQTYPNVPPDVLKSSSMFVDGLTVVGNKTNSVETATATSRVEPAESQPEDTESDSGSDYESANEKKTVDDFLGSLPPETKHQNASPRPGDDSGHRTDTQITEDKEKPQVLGMKMEEDLIDPDTESEDDDEISWASSHRNSVLPEDTLTQNPAPSPRPSQENDSSQITQGPVSSSLSMEHQQKVRSCEISKEDFHSSNSVQTNSSRQPNSSRHGTDQNARNLVMSSSLPAEDEEMELVVPHTTADPVEESDEGWNSLHHIVDIPSTIPQRNNIQVERTPRSLSSFAKSDQARRGRRYAEQDISGPDLSSSQIIPSTCIDQVSLEPIAARTFEQQHTRSTQNPSRSEDKVSLDQMPSSRSAGLYEAALGFGTAHPAEARRPPAVNTPEQIAAEVVSPIIEYLDHDHTTNSTMYLESPKSNDQDEMSQPVLGQPLANEERQRKIPNSNMDRSETDSQSIAQLVVESSRQKRQYLHSMRTRPKPNVSRDSLKNSPSLAVISREATLESEQSLSDVPPMKSIENIVEEPVAKPQEAVTCFQSLSHTEVDDTHSSVELETDTQPKSQTDQETDIDALNKRIESPRSSPHSSTVFERFQMAYPNFKGSQNHFIRVCVYIEWLIPQHKQPHPYLWDDFMRCLCSEFSAYVKDVTESGEKAMTAVDYFNNEVEVPHYNRRILRPENLQDVLSVNPKFAQNIRNIFTDQHKARNRLISRAEQSEAKEAYKSESKVQHGSTRSVLNGVGPLDSVSPTGVVASENDEGDNVLPVQTSFSDGQPSTVNPRTSLKRPFFETHSQVDNKSQQIETEAVIERNEDEERRKKQRNLPWTATKGSQHNSPTGQNPQAHVGSSSPMTTSSSTTKSRISLGIHKSELSIKNSQPNPSGSRVLGVTSRFHPSSPSSVIYLDAQSDTLETGRHSVAKGKGKTLANGLTLSDTKKHSISSRSFGSEHLDQRTNDASPSEAMGPPPAKPARKFTSTQDLLSSEAGKAYVSRRKRRSATPSSSTSSSYLMSSATRNTLTLDRAVEPETQSWNIN
ncbi:hypothetical protein PVAG01_00972 [Phlyctema vagabunda]|uniref:Shelterin complex subunit TPP1/Est3 domain-containing protein n=1 Tax=Phlyctema vagabunda TaxID=108571 RepID=A0ABR4PW86_9HELO